MSVTPLGLAQSLKRCAEQRRGSITSVQPNPTLSADGKRASFLVYDNDGGILLVEVNQYKEPLR